MSNFVRLFVSLIVFSFVVPFCAFADALIGKVAPGWELTDWSGSKRTLEEFKGKVVVLEWFNHECPYVKKHYNTKNMQKLQREYTERGVVWLVINSSAAGKQGHIGAEEARKIMTEKQGAPSTLLFDHDGKVGRLYGAKTTPHMFIIDSTGILVYAGAIDDNDSSRESSVAAAKNYISTALSEVLAGKPVSTAQTTPYGCSVKY